MSHEEAVEYFEFNIVGAWIGDDTPCFIDRRTEGSWLNETEKLNEG